MSYLPIADYGVIGDMRTAALVSREGGIDWCCLPRFDAPSVFAALLDDARGGSWRIAPSGPAHADQHYLPGTNVLVTVFRGEAGGVLEVVDFMPVGAAAGRATRIMRRVRAVRGGLPARIAWAPRFDYGAHRPTLARRATGVLATDREDDVAALSAPDLDWRLDDGTAIADLVLAEGRSAWLVMTFDDDEVLPPDAHAPDDALNETIRWWDAWSSDLRYAGPYGREVERSALALKLCCYEPSGAVIAAPTTSLPESQMGGRNWDYRYTWLRDSAFVLYALDLLGFRAETDAFMAFLRRVCRRDDGRHLQIMFAPDGARQLPERIVETLGGWRGIGPVRVGNGAVDQFQMDVYGELLATANVWSRARPVSEGTWKVLRDLVGWTAAHWREPDVSIWEPRDEPRHHVFSKIMAWVALDRGVRIAQRAGLAGDLDAWRREAVALHAEILERGWDPGRGAFVQSYGQPHLDAALLIVPKVRFLPRDDPRVRSSLAAIRRELATGAEDLIYRYRGPDGLEGDEGAFVLTSFWVVQNLAMIGEHAEAERLFRLLLHRAGPLGLFAEEIDPRTGEHLGNYPQALSHAALINTAHMLERLRPGRGEGGVSPA